MLRALQQNKLECLSLSIGVILALPTNTWQGQTV
jgi:hypothetical protein